LREFPKAEGTSCECEQPDIDAFVCTYETKLKCRRDQIECDLNNGLPTFKQQIDNIHCQYLNTFKAYLKNVYCETSQIYCQKVADYEAQLKKIKDNAVCRFENSVKQIICKIEQFHCQIIANFKKCLTTRKCRIEQYSCQIDQKSQNIQTSYATCLQQHMTKRENWVKCIFNTLYGTKAKGANYDTAMQRYKAILDNEKCCLTDQFKCKIDEAVKTIKDCYRCNYKCYFNTGCYGFARRQYTKSCKHLPCAPKYLYKLVRLCAFNPKWSGCPIANLKSTTSATQESFDPCPYNQCIDSKACDYLNDLAKKVQQWKCQVNTWRDNAVCALKQKISCMYPRTSWGTCPTQCQINAYQQKLQCQADTWADSKKTRTS
jgi:hypothetical protein